jgi:hemerythrin-like domain-containing protein
MKVIDQLAAEHRVIEQVLDCLESLADECVFEGKLDVAAAREALDFFQTFADHCHHVKEEVHLFPLLENRGVARDGGPVGRMLAEHDDGREHLRALAAALDGVTAGDVAARQQFLDHAWAYVRGLREHIYKEDNYLFPLADRLLTDADRRELDRAFGRMEKQEMGPGTHERYLALADKLANRYGVRPAAAPPATCGCGGHTHG